MKLEELSYEELMAKSRELKAMINSLRDERIAVSNELAFRDNAEQKLKALKALEGLTPDEVARLKSMAQTVSPEGVESAEEMGKVG